MVLSSTPKMTMKYSEDMVPVPTVLDLQAKTNTVLCSKEFEQIFSWLKNILKNMLIRNIYEQYNV